MTSLSSSPLALSSQSFFPKNPLEKLIQDFKAQLQYLQTGKIELKQLLDFIKRCNLKILIEAADRNSELKNYCHAEELQAHWQQCLSNPSTLEHALHTYYEQFDYKPVPTINNFDLICGIYYADIGEHFYKASDSKKQEKGLAYLIKADEYGNDYANSFLNGLYCNEMLQLAQEEPFPTNKLISHLIECEKNNKKYGAAGYIRLGILYSRLATQNILDENSASQMALQHFYTAFLLESLSANLLYNAYHGDEITTINGYSVYTVGDLYTRYSSDFAPDTRDIAEKAGKMQADLFKQRIRPAEALIPDNTINCGY